MDTGKSNRTCNLGSIMLGGHWSTLSCAHAIIACAFVLVIMVWVDGTRILLPTNTAMSSGRNKLFLPDFRLYAVEREQATPPARRRSPHSRNSRRTRPRRSRNNRLIKPEFFLNKYIYNNCYILCCIVLCIECKYNNINIIKNNNTIKNNNNNNIINF